MLRNGQQIEFRVKEGDIQIPIEQLSELTEKKPNPGDVIEDHLPIQSVLGLLEESPAPSALQEDLDRKVSQHMTLSMMRECKRELVGEIDSLGDTVLVMSLIIALALYVIHSQLETMTRANGDAIRLAGIESELRTIHSTMKTSLEKE